MILMDMNCDKTWEFHGNITGIKEKMSILMVYTSNSYGFMFDMSN